MQNYDVIIVGGGLVGLPFSLMLARRGLSVAVLDRIEMPVQMDAQFDGRTTAFSLGSKNILSKDGLWDGLNTHACPIEFIRVLDGGSPRTLDFDCHDVDGQEPFGWIIENRIVRHAMFEAARTQENLTYLAPVEVTDFQEHANHITVTLKDGQTLKSSLLVGCDGRQSFIRNKARIEAKGWSYHQKAVVFTVCHEKPHENVAIEHFLPAGPFAVLPMLDDAEGRHRSSIVWTEHGEGDHSLINLSEEEFNIELRRHFGDSLGHVVLEGKRFHYPLTLVHARQYTKGRIALVGEAAHGIHPIAGQGLNLCMRDVDRLVDLIVEGKQLGLDIGSEQLLSRYERSRRVDNTAMSVTTDFLNRFFSNDVTPVRHLRQFGIGLVEQLPFAKQFFMRQAMGLQTFAPTQKEKARS